MVALLQSNSCPDEAKLGVKRSTLDGHMLTGILFCFVFVEWSVFYIRDKIEHFLQHVITFDLFLL